MPLQELENKQKIEIIEDLPETKEEPKKRKPEELENPSLWQRFKDKVIRPIKNVVFSLYNRIVLGKNYSNTVAKDYDRARDEGLIDGMFDDGEYTPEDLTSEQLEEEKDVLGDFERKDLGNMFDAPPEEIKIAQKDMTTILKEKINEFSEKENVDKVKLISRSYVLNNEISLEKDKLNNISISFKGKNMHKDFILSPPYEEQDIDKLTQEYQNFFSELKKEREIELEVMKMFEDPKQTKEDTQTKEDKEIEEEKNETREIVEEKEDVAEIPNFSNEKQQQENELEPDVSEIPDLDTLNDTSLDTDSSFQSVKQNFKNIPLPTESQLLSTQRKMQSEFNDKLHSFLSSPELDNETINYNENFLLHQINIQKNPQTDDIEIKINRTNEFTGFKEEQVFNLSYPYKTEDVEAVKEEYHNFIKDFQSDVFFRINQINGYQKTAQEAQSLENKENITIKDIESAIAISQEAYFLADSICNRKYLPKIPHWFEFKINNNNIYISYTTPRQDGTTYLYPKIKVNGNSIYEKTTYGWTDEIISVGAYQSYEDAVKYLKKDIFNSLETEKSSITYIALSKDAFNKCVEKAENGDKVLAQTKTKDKSLADVLFERDNGEDRITIGEVVQSPKNTKNALNNIVDKNKQKEFKTAVITTVETINTYNEKGDYVVMSDTLTARLSVKEEELTISVETLGGEVKEATIAYPPEKSKVTQTITDLLSQPEQNRTADQPLVVSVAEAIIEDKLPDDDSLTDISIGENKTFAEMLEESYSNSNFEYKDGEMIEIEEEQGDDFGL